MTRSRARRNVAQQIDHAIAHSLFRDDATIEPFRTTGVADLVTFANFGHPTRFGSAST